MRLSRHFKLEEFTLSQTATRLDIDMTPPEFAINNLTRLCLDFLEPIRVELDKPIFISSGYRPEALNKAIGGSATSAHVEGRAADFTVVGFTPHKVCREIIGLDLLFDQLIHEFGRWVHLGIVKTDHRLQTLTAFRSEGLTVYTPGIHQIKDLI